MGYRTSNIDFTCPTTFRAAFAFPLQSSASRKDLLIGALWLLVPGLGWLLNMGHRIAITHNLLHGEPAWPAWHNYPSLFKHGVLTFLGMILYHSPAIVFGYFAWQNPSPRLIVPALALWALAAIAVPGYMTHYSYTLDPSEIFNPFRALRRVAQGGWLYWKAWLIALTAMLVSFAGLLAFGVGFLITSVWFWQVAAFSFASVFAQRFAMLSVSEV
ncbi:MAG: DUF4013 domain-containing protein [Phycisphaeraceae bacterium]